MHSLSSALPSLYWFAGQILRLSLWLVLLAVIFTPLERLFALHPDKIWRKSILTDLIYYFMSSLLPGIVLTLPLALVSWSVRHFIPVGYLEAVAALPLAVRVVVSLVLGEIGFYWGHRWTHEIPLLWRFHAVHHSAEHMDFLVNTRAHPVDMVFVRLCGLVPLYITGFASPTRGVNGLVPLLVVLVATLWGFFIHANLKWRFGPLEYLVATPAFHHWHHTNDGPALINKNYASLLPFLDQFFGTLYLPKHTPAKYGIDEALPSTLKGQLLGPFGQPVASPQVPQDERLVTK